MADLIKALNQYQLTKTDNCYGYKNNIPVVRKHSLTFIKTKGHDVCNLLSNGPEKHFKFPNKKLKQQLMSFYDLII